MVYVDGADQLYITYGERVRVLCHPTQGQVQLSVRLSAVDHLWLLSHPLFTLPFIELLKRRGRYSLYAAGLCIDGQGLRAGPSGAGKSTLALALVRAGWGFLEDDTLFLTQAQDGLCVLAFPDEVDVTDETAGFFPELHTLVQRPPAAGWPKRQVRAEDVYSVDLVWECRPAVVIFARVAHTATSVLTPLRRGDALLALLPNVVLTEAHSSQAHFNVLAALVSESACYRLETGRDFDVLPGLLHALVAQG